MIQRIVILSEENCHSFCALTIKEGMEKGIEKGIEIGLTRGREENRRELVRKKLAKGKPVPAIAEELEEDVSVIEEIVNDLNA